MHSPPRRKKVSPSRVPKALLSEERQTYLNLINLQPTSRHEDEVLEEIYLTTAEKDLFEAQNDRNGFYTKRQRNWENQEVGSFSANKGTTIDFSDKKDQDLIVIKDIPFNELVNLPSD